MIGLRSPQSITPSSSPRVEILGVFGSGKTTLASQLSAVGFKPLGEVYERNPFWREPNSLNVLGYLPYDIAFLLQHIHLIATAPRSSAVQVCDWSLLSDRLWASMRLENDFDTYDRLYKRLVSGVGDPIGYLHIRLSPETISSRIRSRGRANESYLVDDVEIAAARLEELANEIPSEKVITIDSDTLPSEVALKVSFWMKNAHGRD
jgi:deoxyadenosine/deoxycytidine kinase